ncbi:dehydrogenase/reductase SDR family member 7 isoform X1 [Populus alba x Populus x berolinensis]|uniref:Dehydrogenase/reductase SDR family member 7 isoform X1 n=1 Tax=Populus alba x Populus x berolinensis TaxID=444605 RepID=A0AAD6LXQ3_9ROSI|nr:dehydrogenase/reductase SDR family member 7 isoform X1 [Populus alba x Populus x berolinensis]
MIFIFLSLLLLVALLYKFLTSDGDFTLMSKRHAKREEIEDKVVWITGASRGIGEVLAKQLASLGAKLILSSRNEAELERVKNQLTGKHAPGEVKIIPLDLASGEEFLKEAVEKAESFFSGAGVDYMIHNAAYERPKSTALDVNEESLKATFNINVLGPISLTRLLASSMLSRGRGHFVVMSSAAGKTPTPGQAIYSASKFALNGYFHSLRSEFVPIETKWGIRSLFSWSIPPSVHQDTYLKQTSEPNYISQDAQEAILWLCQKGIKVTIVCPGPIETSNGFGSTTSGKKGTFERRVSSERCAELTIIAATHGLKEVWISDQPVLAVLYLVQYMPTVGYWLMDKIGGNRLAAAAQKGNTYSLSLLFGKKKAT